MARGKILEKVIEDSIDVKISICWLSLFAEGANFEKTKLKIPSDLKRLIDESKYLAETYYDVDLNKNKCYLVYDWLEHKSIKRITAFIPLSEVGTFVTVILRTVSFIEETMKIMLAFMFEETPKYQRRCSSTVCSQVSFKDRDSVGARNILRCLAERERPKSLTRINGSGALKLTNFMLRTGAIGSTAA